MAMDLTGRQQYEAQALDFLNRRGEEIFGFWLEKLDTVCGKKAELRIEEMKKARQAGTDLLTCLASQGPKESLRQTILPDLLLHIQTEHYFISDFVLEMLCLQQAINLVAVRQCAGDDKTQPPFLQIIESDLAELVGTVLQKTADIFEYTIETGGRSFCHTDPEGKILYANSVMIELLGYPDVADVVGHRLADFFAETDSAFLTEKLTAQPGEESGLRCMRLIQKDDKTILVGVEINSIHMKGHYLGGYAAFVDLSKTEQTQHDFFDRSEAGIVTVVMIPARNQEERDWRFAYVNPLAQKMLGLRQWQGQSVRALFPDADVWKRMQGHLEDRFLRGVAEEYELEIVRPSDHRIVPIKIAAIPETDLRGKVVGSTAFVQSRELDKVLAEARDAQKLLEEVADILFSIVDYDLMTVTFFDPEMKEARLIFSKSPKEKGAFPWQIRWWKMPPGMDDWLRSEEVEIVPDFLAFLEKSGFPEVQKDRHVQPLLEKDLHSFMSFRLLVGTTVPSSLTLFRKGVGKFCEEDKKMLKALPLRRTLMTLQRLEGEKAARFRFRTISEIISVCDDLKKIADVITRNMVESFGWDNVSIFQVDNQIWLLSQKAREDNPDFLLDQNYEQKTRDGILGHVLRMKDEKGVNIGDLPVNPAFKGLYKKGYRKEVRSECCITMRINGRLCWLLNIEDERWNALSETEYNELKETVKELQMILDRALLHIFIDKILKSASDAIIVTDHCGVIQKVNPAAQKMLGPGSADLSQENVRRYFADFELFKWIMKGGAPPEEGVLLLSNQGVQVPVLLSASPLEKKGAGWVFVARDQTYRKKLEELKYLGSMYHEIAIQTKTPLSLVVSWVERLRKKPEEKTAETLDKILKQLQKIELTYDRLALFEQQAKMEPSHRLLDLGEIVEVVLGELPNFEFKKVLNIIESNDLKVRGDLWQFSFCLRTVLSYLLRFAPDQEKAVLLRQYLSQGSACLEVEGIVPELPASVIGKVREVQPLSKTLQEMALGQRILRRFIEGHGGSFEIKTTGQEVKVFKISLPQAKEEE
jgi:PAS domain S-box-containing protein